jgi:hypothetical protein
MDNRAQNISSSSQCESLSLRLGRIHVQHLSSRNLFATSIRAAPERQPTPGLHTAELGNSQCESQGPPQGGINAQTISSIDGFC